MPAPDSATYTQNVRGDGLLDAEGPRTRLISPKPDARFVHLHFRAYISDLDQGPRHGSGGVLQVVAGRRSPPTMQQTSPGGCASLAVLGATLPRLSQSATLIKVLWLRPAEWCTTTTRRPTERRSHRGCPRPDGHQRCLETAPKSSRRSRLFALCAHVVSPCAGLSRRLGTRPRRNLLVCQPCLYAKLSL